MMRNFRRIFCGVVVLSVVIAGRFDDSGPTARAQDGDEGWTIPPNAAKEANPIAPNDKVLAKGKDIFKAKCQKCHGVSGKGDGPDADPKHKPGNLTDGSRASRNPDGVMFYKVWNGRAKPKMPAFKSELSKDDIWTVITYVKTLRQ
jgi:mono/diheme cytochrome c family protein